MKQNFRKSSTFGKLLNLNYFRKKSQSKSVKIVSAYLATLKVVTINFERKNIKDAIVSCKKICASANMQVKSKDTVDSFQFN